MPTVAKASCPDIGLWIFPVIQWMARFRQSPHRRLQCRSHRVLSPHFQQPLLLQARAGLAGWVIARDVLQASSSECIMS